jgi:hypothetical protein
MSTYCHPVDPISGLHVNLFGAFEFSPANSKVDIDALVARYADPVYWSKALQDLSEAPLD